MNRFSDEKKNLLNRMTTGIPLIFVAMLVLVFGSGIFWMQDEAGNKEADTLKQSLNQSVILCYALEGTYPESLEYLKTHYGIQWDQSRYLVDFEVVGSNLPPDITVITKNQK